MLKVYLSIFCMILTMVVPRFADAAWTAPSLQALKQKAKSNLLERKKGFDAYLQKKQRMEAQRLSDADKMKTIRKAYEKKREQARKNFRRKTESFPKEAYQAFLQKREKRRSRLENARENYVSVQDELEKVYENKKYKINGKREFDLE